MMEQFRYLTTQPTKLNNHINVHCSRSRRTLKVSQLLPWIILMTSSKRLSMSTVHQLLPLRRTSKTKTLLHQLPGIHWFVYGSLRKVKIK